MSAPARSRLALSFSLLLGGCYVGLDGDVEGGSTSSTTGDATTSPATVEPTATDTTADPTNDPTNDAGTGATGEVSGDASTGGVGASTGGDDTTPMTSDPGTSDPTATTTGATGDETTGGADSGMPPPVDVPDNAHCVDVADWDPAWAQLEQDILVLVNQVRAQGANCGTKGAFGPAGPLTMHPALRCAARKHSADIAARNFFDHVNPDGEVFTDRMAAAGYGSFSTAGENIAAGSPDAQGTMSQWMGSDGHCANIMNLAYKDIGVGYSTGGQYGHLWTQVFGAK